MWAIQSAFVLNSFFVTTKSSWWNGENSSSWWFSERLFSSSSRRASLANWMDAISSLTCTGTVLVKMVESVAVSKDFFENSLKFEIELLRSSDTSRTYSVETTGGVMVGDEGVILWTIILMLLLLILCLGFFLKCLYKLGRSVKETVQLMPGQLYFFEISLDNNNMNNFFSVLWLYRWYSDSIVWQYQHSQPRDGKHIIHQSFFLITKKNTVRMHLLNSSDDSILK